MAMSIIHREPIPPGEEGHFLKHVCPPTFGGENTDPVTPTVVLARDLDGQIDLDLPDGRKVRLWVIEDPEDSEHGKVFPSKLIRVREGDVVHARVGGKLNTHTIHWHGIEPSPMNDGVGKHSFEVAGNFVMQWQASHAGTFFYHCHKNTTLHFEMGLYGLLVVDPPEGEGFVRRLAPEQGNLERYDVEAFWVPDEIDTVWHRLGHEAFMQKCDANDPAGPLTFSQDGILNKFRPDVFVITGVPTVDDDTPIDDPRVAVSARVGQTVLLRVLNAGYTVQQYTFGFDAEVIAMDGRALGVPPDSKYSHPFLLRAGTPFRLTSAMRWDLLVKPTAAGTYPAVVEFFDWVNGKKYATARTSLRVS